MPDISMCTDHECPSRVHCFRYRAKPNPYRQSYADFKREGEQCDVYWSTSGRADSELEKMEELEPKDGER